MKPETLFNLVEMFFKISGDPANEVWIHPSMLGELWNEDNRVFNLEQGGMTRLNLDTPYGSLKIMRDASIMPGTVYLDRDGKHTQNQRKARRDSYYGFNFNLVKKDEENSDFFCSRGCQVGL